METEYAERVELLKKALRRQAELGLFNMEVWIGNTHTCGTAACIGGTIDMLMHPDMNPQDLAPSSAKVCGEWIGLPAPIAQGLFYPPEDKSHDGITAEQAIQAMDFAFELARNVDITPYEGKEILWTYWNERLPDVSWR